MVDNGPWECAEVLSIYIYTCLSSVPFFGMGWLEFRGGSRRLPRKKTAETFLSRFLIVSLMIWFVDEQNMSTSRMMGKEPVSFEVFCSCCWVICVGRCYTKSLRFSPMSLILLTCKGEVFVVSSSCLLADRSNKASPTNSKQPRKIGC